MDPRSPTIFAPHTWHRAVAVTPFACLSQFTQAQEELHQELLVKEAQRLQELSEQERREAQNAKQMEALRLEQIKRMAKLATPAPVPSLPASSPKATSTPGPTPPLALSAQPAITSPSGGGGSGNTQQAAGPSSSYAGRLLAKLKPNITLLEETRVQISGNPEAEVEVNAVATPV